MNILELNPLRIGMEIPRINICPYCGGRERTVAGIPPLSFSARMRAKLVRLTQYGKCVQKPVTYLASVTQTGKCEQRNLPSGYTQYDYLQSNGTQLMQLDITRVSGKAYAMAVDIEASVFGSTSSGMFTLGADYAGYCVVSRKWGDDNMVMMNGSVQSSGIIYAGRATYTVSVASDGKTCTLTDGTNTASYARTTTNYTNKPVLFGLNDNYKGSVKIYSAKLWEDGVLLFDLVPCKNSENVYGMFNKVDGTFIAPLVGTFVAGDVAVPTPTTPMDIWCNNGVLKWDSTTEQVIADGTPEVLSVGGQNRSVPNLLGVGDYKDTYELISGLDTHNIGIKVFDGTEAFEELENAAIIQGATAAWGAVARAVGLCTHLVSLAAGETARAGTYRFATALNFYWYKTTFGVNSIPELKSLLAGLYAAGKPVIMLFPLATATTETVTVAPIDRTYPQTITATAEVSDVMVTETHADVSTPDPVHPLPIWCNNGKLTKSANLVDVNGQTPVNLAYVTNKLVTKAERYGYYIKVKPNTKYTVSINREKTGAYLNICETTSEPANNVVVQAYNTMDDTTASKTITTKANTNYLYIYTAYVSGYHPFERGDFQIEEGETASTYHPYVYTDGTPEVLTISGINLLDPSTSNIKIGQQVTANGDISSAYPNNWRSDYIPVVGGKTYAFWGRAKADGTISAYNRINWYTADKTHIYPRPSYTVGTVTVGTAPSNAAFAMLSCSPYKSDAAITREDFDLFNWMFAEESAEVPYQPYVTPQTANVEALLGVETYNDTQEVLSGLIGGKVGVKVFDGTESWEGQSTHIWRLNFGDRVIGKIPLLCSHFNYSTGTSATMENQTIASSQNSRYIFVRDDDYDTRDDFKAWLASRYAAGDPVIVIYPLATPTTEQVAGQALYANKGTNTVDIQAEVEGIEVSLTYKD